MNFLADIDARNKYTNAPFSRLIKGLFLQRPRYQQLTTSYPLGSRHSLKRIILRNIEEDRVRYAGAAEFNVTFLKKQMKLI